MVSEPIAPAERDRLFEGLARIDRLGLAVSGGADSMALMHLVAGWCESMGRSRADIVVLTVDHGLRPDSSTEAEWVATRAKALGFAHATLVWSGDKPSAGVQEAARAARYRLLLGEARRRRVSAICLAHTQDDQAETVLMRLARGSGIDGLAAMRSRSLRAGIALLRPLLAVPHARLVATLEALGADWLEDPSNADLRFERVRLRRLMPRFAEAGLTAEAVSRSAWRLQRAQAALEVAVDRWIAEAARLEPAGHALLDRARLNALPEEIALRILARVLRAVGGEASARRPPRLAKREALLTSLGGTGFVGLTLSGCLIRSTGDGARVGVFREPGRESLPRLLLRPGEVAIWDNRFEVSLSPALEQPLVVRALGEAGLATLRQWIAARQAPAPREALVTLPAFWQDEAVFAVPVIGYFATAPDHEPGAEAERGAARPPCAARLIATLTRDGTAAWGGVEAGTGGRDGGHESGRW